MPKFRIHTKETTVIHRFHDVEAESEDDAYEIADNTADWSKWEVEEEEEVNGIVDWIEVI